MGTSKPLSIAIHPSLKGEAWVAILKQKGHSVFFPCDEPGTPDEDRAWDCSDIWEADLILGPTCARFLPGMAQFLDSFIKGARALKYGKVKP